VRRSRTGGFEKRLIAVDSILAGLNSVLSRKKMHEIQYPHGYPLREISGRGKSSILADSIKE
jgi:hypothetical protein